MAPHSRQASSASRPSIVIVSNGLVVGGAETQTVRIASELARRGMSVRILSILPSTAFTEILDDHSIELVELPRWRRFGVLPVLFSATRLLRRWQPDAVIGFVYQSNIVARVAGTLARVPTVVSSFRLETEKTAVRRWILRATDFLSDASTFDSGSVADATVGRRTTRPDKAVVIPNALDLEAIDSAWSRRDQMRAEHGLDGRFVWVAVGRVVAEKDHENLLRAWAELPTHRAADRLLVVVGDGPLRTGLEQRARDLGIADSVRWLGTRRDALDWLAAADAFVLSSRTESSPNALLEAATMGRPVVATDVGGTREFDPDGIAVRYVRAESSHELAAAMALTEDRAATDPAGERKAQTALSGQLRNRHDRSTVADLWLRACGLPPSPVAQDNSSA